MGPQSFRRLPWVHVADLQMYLVSCIPGFSVSKGKKKWASRRRIGCAKNCVFWYPGVSQVSICLVSVSNLCCLGNSRLISCQQKAMQLTHIVSSLEHCSLAQLIGWEAERGVSERVCLSLASCPPLAPEPRRISLINFNHRNFLPVSWTRLLSAYIWSTHQHSGPICTMSDIN